MKARTSSSRGSLRVTEKYARVENRRRVVPPWKPGTHYTKYTRGTLPSRASQHRLAGQKTMGRGGQRASWKTWVKGF
ncbi:hypothetical protein E2C01_076778 [Portunus trituberculatus]|uniref:Uncharacterized protein n=1 Tax=Portunus trituberculatus TaxID=210409 RepID=A0A5B7IE30_PORTR|nr:hypothetical protein [Portunus trituberculatus]